MQKEIQLNDYQQCKSVIETLKKGKQVMLPVNNVRVFRKYLSTNAKEVKKTFITKVIDSENVFVIRIS